MKGLLFGRSVQWSCGQAMLAERNPHLWLQYLLLGLDVEIDCNVVVPTQWSLLYTQQRTLLLCRLWQEHSPAFGASQMEVLEKQEQCLVSCAVCAASLPYHDRLPYQMALRLVAGAETYDVLLGMLCRSCQTTPWHTLLPTTLEIYPALCLAIARLAFEQPLNEDDDPVAQYLERIDWLNDYVPTVLAATQGLRCAHCGHIKKRKQLQVCPWGCEAVNFCRAGPCLETAAYYHERGLCAALKEGRLFHVLEATIVDITGQPHEISSWRTHLSLL